MSGITIQSNETISGHPVLTVAIDDGSDGKGLKVGQIVNVTGRPGKYRVLKVHTPLGQSRVYDIVQVPGNRAQRRKRAHNTNRQK